MKNFDENLEKITEEENNDDLDQVNSDESDEEFIDKTDENGEPSIDVGNENITLEQENEISKINEIKSEESEEELLARRIRDYHRNLIEASLYVSGKPLTIEEISTRLEIPKKEVEELINDVAFDYLERSTALIVNKVGDSYQMSLKTEYIEKVSKFAKGGAIAEKYLRTLTVIALKQPILKSLVIKIRGTGAYEHIKYLFDNELISGIKKGRSQELSTTDKYAEMFGLPKDKQLMKTMMIAQLDLDDE